MTTVEVMKQLAQAASRKEVKTQLPFYEPWFFRRLRKIHLEKLGGPFALKGQSYLESNWKRGFDISASAVSLVLAGGLPVMAAAFLAKWVESPTQTPWVVQWRLGKEKKEFPMIKIRSKMVNEAGTDDLPATTVGKVLRVTSLDETPQLINVLCGHMSFVGSRPLFEHNFAGLRQLMMNDLPFLRTQQRLKFDREAWDAESLPKKQTRLIKRQAHLPREITKVKWFQFEQNLRDFRPGLTGLCQVLVRRTDNNHRVELDNFYYQHASLGLDLAILVSTIPAVLLARGAR